MTWRAGTQEGGEIFVGPLARRLGIRPATLRKWERAGLVQPRRHPQTGYRVYSASVLLARGADAGTRFAAVNAVRK